MVDESAESRHHFARKQINRTSRLLVFDRPESKVADEISGTRHHRDSAEIVANLPRLALGQPYSLQLEASFNQCCASGYRGSERVHTCRQSADYGGAIRQGVGR
jgi:hypothetical protein